MSLGLQIASTGLVTLVMATMVIVSLGDPKNYSRWLVTFLTIIFFLSIVAIPSGLYIWIWR